MKRITKLYAEFKEGGNEDYLYDMVHEFVSSELDRGDLIELLESYVKLDILRNTVTVDIESKSEFEKRVRQIIN